MPFTPDLVDELNLLMRFTLTTMHEGLKIHHTADTPVIEAARRLHAKGLISQADGGYLTNLGRETAEHAHAVLTVLQGKP